MCGTIYKKMSYWIIVLGLLASTYVDADEVVLKEGDVLQGRIIKTTETSITLLHKVLGELEIPKDDIVAITVVHDVLGEITIDADGIASFGMDKTGAKGPEEKRPSGRDQPSLKTQDTESGQVPADQKITSPTVESDKQQAQQEQEKKGAWFEPEFQKLNAFMVGLKKTGWSFAGDLSLNTSTGNTQEETSRLGVHIKRTLPRERQAFDASYYHKTTDGDTTDNKLTSGAVHDWLMPGSRWFYFGLARFDLDEFESWEKRFNVQVGPGYNLLTSDRMLLDFRLGAGPRKEWGSDNNELKLEGLFGFDFQWKMTDKQSLDAIAQWYPVVTNFNDYRTRLTFNWRYLLAKDMNLSLLLGVVREYQSIVDPGLEDTDTRVFTGIQVRF
ncbi:MAG: DUF481 domain-containing protein [Planctomycetota bacterium]|jgi:putative salt-induced outer membrane protein YdiY